MGKNGLAMPVTLLFRLLWHDQGGGGRKRCFSLESDVFSLSRLETYPLFGGKLFGFNVDRLIHF